MATKKTQSHTDPRSADLSVLKNPRITEKAANAAGMQSYLFDVAFGATKSEIAKAFEAVYKHKPLKVNVVNVRRKSFFRRGKLGFGTMTKKAYVFLPKGVTIEIM
jgi:large subunit ribosomal protein L23